MADEKREERAVTVDEANALIGIYAGLTAEEVAARRAMDAQRTSWLATIIGYNELAKSAPILGEKVYYRLALGHARDQYTKFGGKLEMKNDEGDFTLVLDSESRPYINFKAKDIELMRQTIAEYDAKTGNR